MQFKDQFIEQVFSLPSKKPIKISECLDSVPGSGSCLQLPASGDYEMQQWRLRWLGSFIFMETGLSSQLLTSAAIAGIWE